MPGKLQRLAILVTDALLFAGIWVLAYNLRFAETGIPQSASTLDDNYLLQMKLLLPWVVLTHLALYGLLNLYRGIIRYVGTTELRGIIIACFIQLGLWMGVNAFLYQQTEFLQLPQRQMTLNPDSLKVIPIPWSILGLYIMMSAMATGGLRFSKRLLLEATARSEGAGAAPTLIVGSGDLADNVLRNISRGSASDIRPVCAVASLANRVGLRLHGVPVVGTIEKIPDVIREYKIEKVLIAMDDQSPAELRRVISACETAEVSFRIVPSLRDIESGRVALNSMREIEVEDLLGREPVNIDLQPDRNYLRGRSVLITGAGGSIGSELARQCARAGAARLILLGKGENSIFQISNEIRKSYSEVEVIAAIADIRDEFRIDALLSRHRPSVVYHAAAHKHVPLMEDAPEEAVKNNVLGTAIVAFLSERHGVERFVLISSDKAVRPSSVMGATKRYAEMVLFSLSQSSTCCFQAVRFGNVLGSRGSVIPVFREQIQRGGPITVTHPDVVRYFMTIPEAVSLVLQAASRSANGALYLLDMGEPVRIVDLARNMISLSGLRPDLDIKIEYVGLRPGEKLKEELLTEFEGARKTEFEKLFVTEHPQARPMERIREDLKRFRELADVGDGSQLRKMLVRLIPDYHPPDEPIADTASIREQLLEFATLPKQGSDGQLQFLNPEGVATVEEAPLNAPPPVDAEPVRIITESSDPETPSTAPDSVLPKSDTEPIQPFHIDSFEEPDLFEQAFAEAEPSPSILAEISEPLPEAPVAEGPVSKIAEEIGAGSEVNPPSDGDLPGDPRLQAFEESFHMEVVQQDHAPLPPSEELLEVDDNQVVEEVMQDFTSPNTPLAFVDVVPVTSEQSSLVLEEPTRLNEPAVLAEVPSEDLALPDNTQTDDDSSEVMPVAEEEVAIEPVESSEIPVENSLDFGAEKVEVLPEILLEISSILEVNNALQVKDSESDTGELVDFSKEQIDKKNKLISPDDTVPLASTVPQFDHSPSESPSEVATAYGQGPNEEPETNGPDALPGQVGIEPFIPNNIQETEDLADIMAINSTTPVCAVLRVAKDMDADTLAMLVGQVKDQVLSANDRLICVGDAEALKVVPSGQASVARDGKIEGALFAEALRQHPEAGVLITFSTEVLMDGNSLNLFRAALGRGAPLAYSDYKESKDEVISEVKLHDHNNCPHERFEFGPVIAYSVEQIKAVGGIREDLNFAWEYDLHLKLAEKGAFGHITEFTYTRFVPFVTNEKGGKVFSPGMGPLGGFSYVFYPEAVEKEVTSVFEAAMKRRGTWIDHPAVAVNHNGAKYELLASIVIPILNRVKYIANAIEKVQKGTFQDFEIVIIDNGSTDGTIQLVEQIAAKDSRIRLIHGKGGSIASALNEGIKSARGKYICQLDSDDEYSPDCLEMMIGHLESHPNCGLAISYYRLMDENGVIIEDIAPITHGGYSRNQILRRDGGGAVRIFPKVVLQEFGYYDEEHYGNFGEDYDMVLKTGEKYDVDRVHKVLYHYRRHSDNTDVTRDPAMKYHNKNRARQEALRRRREVNQRLGKA